MQLIIQTLFGLSFLVSTVTQKRVHMFCMVRKIDPYLHEYSMNSDNLNYVRKVCIIAFWPYALYAVTHYIRWDNQIIAQLHMWTLFLLLNSTYYMLDYSTKSISNFIKLYTIVYSYYYYVSARYWNILSVYDREM